MNESELCWASSDHTGRLDWSEYTTHVCYRPYGHDGPHICDRCGHSWWPDTQTAPG